MSRFIPYWIFCGIVGTLTGYFMGVAYDAGEPYVILKGILLYVAAHGMVLAFALRDED